MVILAVLIYIVLVVESIRFYLLVKKHHKAESVLKKRATQLRMLSFLLTSIYESDEPIKDCFPRFLNHLKENLGFTYHSIFRLDEQKQCLVIRFTGYLPSWYMEELSNRLFIKVGDASVGRAVATKQPVTINAANLDPRFKSITPIAGQTGYRSLSCYPMIGKLKTHGGFCAYSEHENIFTLQDSQFFATIANFLAAILEDKLLSHPQPIRG